MYLKKAHATFVSICSLLAATLTATAGGADVDNYLIAKGQSFSQISASTPQSIPSDNPFRATAIITPAGAASVTSASIKGPTGHTATLSYEDGRWSSEGEYSNKLTLDHNIPAGKYTLTIATADQGTVQPALLIGPDAYPSTPHVANWTDAQNVEADQPFTLTWDTFVGGTSNDTIIVQAESDDGSTTVFHAVFAGAKRFGWSGHVSGHPGKHARLEHHLQSSHPFHQTHVC
jgi:hypothetical protein